MNPLRNLAQFIAFIHENSWGFKSALIYRFIHFTGLLVFFFLASAIYLDYFQVYSLPIKEQTAVFIFIPIILLLCTYLLFFGKRPYLKFEYKNWQVAFGGVIWVMLWIYILPMFWILKD